MADQLTEDQIACYSEAFTLFDTDLDGKIPPRDLGLVMRSLGQNPSEADLVVLISELGITNEQHIDFATFLTVMARQLKKEDATEANLIEAFAIFDKTGDGFIPTEELRYVMGSLGEKLNDTELDELCTEFERDGKVNYINMVKIMFGIEKDTCDGFKKSSSTNNTSLSK